MKEDTEPAGRELIDEMLATVDKYDAAYSQSDKPALIKLYGQTIKSLRQLIPHLKSEKHSAGAKLAADKCEKVMKKLMSNTASVGELDELSRMSANLMKAEL